MKELTWAFESLYTRAGSCGVLADPKSEAILVDVGILDWGTRVDGDQLEDVCILTSCWCWCGGSKTSNGGSDNGLGEHFESV